jgi:hypothetical protein
MKPVSRIQLSSVQDRRRRRTTQVMEALHFALDACREGADLTAIVVADEFGLTLASSGSQATCDELSARLPILARKAGSYQGVLTGARGLVPVAMKRFTVANTELYCCAIGGDREQHAAQLYRAEMGVRRILAA